MIKGILIKAGTNALSLVLAVTILYMLLMLLSKIKGKGGCGCGCNGGSCGNKAGGGQAAPMPISNEEFETLFGKR